MMGMKETVSNIVTSQAEKGGVKHVYYVACGGSYAAFYPAKAFLEKEAKALTVGLYNSGEFINNPPVALGENAVVVVASHKGNTPETIKAAEIARQHGAPVIGLTWIMDSPLVAHCDYVETYTFGDGKDIAGEKTMKGLLSAVELLQQTEGYAHYDDFQDGVSKSTVSSGALASRLRNARRRSRRNIKTIKSFTPSPAARAMAQPTYRASASLWKCNGYIPPVFIAVSFSTGPLKLPMRIRLSSSSFPRAIRGRWMNAR